MSDNTNEIKLPEINLHSGHRERLREKIELTGIDNIPPHEVLEYLLFMCIPRRDTNPLAHELINRFGSLSAVLEADIHELEKVKGISHATALFLNSIPAITRYYFKDRWKERPVATDNVIIGQYLCDLFAGEKNEAFYVMSLDSSRALIKTDLVYRGTINETPIQPRAVVEKALKNNAAAVILAHNHPGGNLSASPADVQMTRLLVDVFNSLLIQVVDHFIICGSKFSSMKNKGHIGETIKYSVREATDGDLNGDWNFD